MTIKLLTRTAGEGLFCHICWRDVPAALQVEINGEEEEVCLTCLYKVLPEETPATETP